MRSMWCALLLGLVACGHAATPRAGVENHGAVSAADRCAAQVRQIRGPAIGAVRELTIVAERTEQVLRVPCADGERADACEQRATAEAKARPATRAITSASVTGEPRGVIGDFMIGGLRARVEAADEVALLAAAKARAGGQAIEVISVERSYAPGTKHAEVRYRGTDPTGRLLADATWHPPGTPRETLVEFQRLTRGLEIRDHAMRRAAMTATIVCP